MSADLLDFDPSHGLREAVVDGDAALLAVLLRKHGNDAALRERSRDFGGTLHFHALSTMMLMAMQPDTEVLAPKFAACARALLAHGAPVEHDTNPNGIAMVFLDSHWSTSAQCDLIAGLMGEYIAAGQLDPNAVVPVHTAIAGLAPIGCALKFGNPMALSVLLGGGANIEAALSGTGCDDVIEYARSFQGPGAEEVISVLAEHLMRGRLRDVAGATAALDGGEEPPRRRRVVV